MIQKESSKKKRMILEYFEGHFGIKPGILNSFGFYAGLKGRIFLGPKKAIDRPSIVSLGILIARINGSIKPSTNLFHMFGTHVKKNFVSLTKKHAVQYIHGDDLELSAAEINEAEEGYILVKYLNFPLGCGLLKENRIKNMLPKAKRLDVKFI